MKAFGFVLLLTLCAFLVQSRNINQLQTRDFDLHNAMRMAYDTEHLKTVLGKATEAEIREFVKSIRQDCKDIEDVITKLITHDWSTKLELSDEEHEILFHILIMDSYLPNIGDDEEGEDIFIDECEEEYMATDFSKYSTFEEAQLDALVQILTCGSNGWRTMDKILDLGHISEKQLKDVDFMASVLAKVARGVREMFMLGRFFEIVAMTDSSAYTDPSSFNTALKDDAVTQMDKKSTQQNANKISERIVNTKPTLDARKVSSATHSLSNIKDIKSRMLLDKILRALNDKRK